MPRTYTYDRVEGLNRALRSISKEASVQLRDASGRIAKRVASDAARSAREQGGAAALVAPTIRAGRDRVPLVRMGSAKRLPPRNGKPRRGSHQTIGDIIWGAEFGGGARPATRQFRPWLGSGRGAGYFLWPAVRDDHDWIGDEYGDALVAAIDASARGAH